MKKHILSLALVAAMFSTIAAGCSSVSETVNSDSTVVDSTTKTTTTTTDTVTKVDTVKKDSVKP